MQHLTQKYALPITSSKATALAPNPDKRPSSPQLTPYLEWAQQHTACQGSHCFSPYRSWGKSTGCFVHEKLCSTALLIWVLCPTTHRYLLLSYMFALWATDAVIRLITSV